jgi:hypothetical protein
LEYDFPALSARKGLPRRGPLNEGVVEAAGTGEASCRGQSAEAEYVRHLVQHHASSATADRCSMRSRRTPRSGEGQQAAVLQVIGAVRNWRSRRFASIGGVGVDVDVV